MKIEASRERAGGCVHAPAGVAVRVLNAHAGIAGNAASTHWYSMNEAKASLTASPIWLYWLTVEGSQYCANPCCPMLDSSVHALQLPENKLDGN